MTTDKATLQTGGNAKDRKALKTFGLRPKVFPHSDPQKRAKGWTQVHTDNGKADGKVLLDTGRRNIQVYSELSHEDWLRIDEQVMEEARKRFKLKEMLSGRGLVFPDDIGILQYQWFTSDEKEGVTISLTGQENDGQEGVARKSNTISVPMFYSDSEVGTRQLRSSELRGSPLDVSNIRESTEVVVEAIEEMILTGVSEKFDLTSETFGITNHPSTITTTATGDWGTTTNIVPTVAKLIDALNTSANRFRGPYTCFANPTQFNQASNVFDGDSFQSRPADRIRTLLGEHGNPSDDSFQSCDLLADGTILLTSLEMKAIQYIEEMPMQVVEWMSPSGMTQHMRVITVGAVIVKDTFSGRTGHALATGA